MDRARAALLAALLIVLSVSGAVVAATSPLAAAAAPSWPVSTALLLAEVQTGGASASDEFFEITNAGSATADLVGLEVVYVTSTGGTVTRKATWASSRPLDPGRHLLVANTAGVDGAIADATYSGGLAATGGALVLRPIGGAPIDAVAWGDATNAFIETTAVAAPPASASIERRPGGLGGNTADSNNNLTDWFAQPNPNPQSLAAPPVPAPGGSPTAAPTSTPSPTATPTALPTTTPSPSGTPTPSDSATPLPSVVPSVAPSAMPSESPVPTATPEPTASTPDPTPSPTPTAEPTATATPLPSPTPEPTPLPTPSPTDTPAPTPSPSPAPTASPSPSPSPTPSPTAVPSPTPAAISIAAARALPDGSSAIVEGVLTTALGAIESGRTAFVQDASGGIAIYLDAAAIGTVPAGTLVRVTGSVDDRYAERTLRVAEADVVVLGPSDLPLPVGSATGSIGEAVEGVRVLIDGLTVGSPTAMADGLGLMVDDGSGPVRAIVGADALGSALVPSGTHVQVMGPVGQHDSSGTGTAAYRVYGTLAGELVVFPAATPSPSLEPTPTPAPSATATAAPSASPSPTPTPNPTPTTGATPAPTASPTATPPPTPTPTPTPTPSAMAIAAARAAPVGSTVTVQGVVTAEAGRLGTPALLSIADGSGAIVVRLPDGAPTAGRGTLLRVVGFTADPYGQLEIRPSFGNVRVVGTGAVPAPAVVTAPDLGEATEASLVQLVGIVKSAPAKGTSGDISIEVTDSQGRVFKAAADASSGIKATDVPRNVELRFVGVVGQHASRKGALDGYKLWLRDRSDLSIVTGPSPSPSPGASPGAGTISIASLLAGPDGTTAFVEATVTAGASLLDTTNRRIVVQDDSGAIEVLLPSGATAPGVGSHLRIGGELAHAWGAPRLKATTVSPLPTGPAIGAASRATQLSASDEWRLVRVGGTVTSVQRMGDRWRAEIRLPNGDRLPVLGQAGAGIPSTALVEGRAITVTGIVKRAYPTATDQRFAVLPRFGADLAVGPGAAGAGSSAPGSASAGSAGRSGADRGAEAPTADVTPDTDLATLFERIGSRVHVGGLITELTTDGFLLDDGTAVARVVLRGDALVLLPHLAAGDALAAWGQVEQDGEDLRIAVASGGDLVRVGDLGQAVPVLAGAGSGGPAATAGGALAPAFATSAALDVMPAELSVVTIGGISLLSVGVTFLRRRAAARRSRAVVVARLATLVAPAAGRRADPAAGGPGARRR